MAQSMKDKLKELEKENHLLTENMIHSIWMIDANTLKYDYISPNIGSLGGYTANEILGQSAFIWLPPESSEQAIRMLKDELKVYKRGEHTSRSFELEMVHKNGNRYWVSDNSFIHYHSNKKEILPTAESWSRCRDLSQCVSLGPSIAR